MKQINTTLGTRLRVLRAENQVTQKELAAAVMVSTGLISSFEVGRYGLNSPLLQRIDEYFKGEFFGKPQLTPNRVELALERDGEGWKVKEYKLYCDE